MGFFFEVLDENPKIVLQKKSWKKSGGKIMEFLWIEKNVGFFEFRKIMLFTLNEMYNWNLFG